MPETESIFVRGEGGSVIKLDLPLHESIQDRMLKGYIVRVANAEGDPYIEAGGFGAPPTWRPSLADSKAAWVGWAVANGMTPDDAEAATKTDLIERFGTDPAPAPEPASEPTPEEAAALAAAEGSQVPAQAGQE